MAHPYKGSRQDIAGKARAKAITKATGGGVGSSRYDDGGNTRVAGEVVGFPIDLRTNDMQRLRSTQGIQSGRIPESGGAPLRGPGYTGGGSKRIRIKGDDPSEPGMPNKRGGRVK